MDDKWLEEMRAGFEDHRRATRKRNTIACIIQAGIVALYLIGLALAIRAGLELT